jgi:hypothetical protein
LLLRLSSGGASARGFGPDRTRFDEVPAGSTCYLLLSLGSSGVVGASDLLCADPRAGSTTGGPDMFALRLEDPGLATLQWRGPGDARTGYVVAPLGGSLLIYGSAISMASVPISGLSCFQLFVVQSSKVQGRSGLLCGVPR